MTGLIAGAFVLSSLYHVFGVEKLKEIARFALVFSFALLPVAMMPLLLHLQQPLRGINVLMTPHFTSAISAFGIVFLTYACIVASELWFVYRAYIVDRHSSLVRQRRPRGRESLLLRIYKVISLGAIGYRAGGPGRRPQGDQDPCRHRHSRRLLPARLRRIHLRFRQGQRLVDDAPDAGHLHLFGHRVGYRPVYSRATSSPWRCANGPPARQKLAVARALAIERRHHALEELRSMQEHEVKMTSKYLLIFMTLAITLELLDIIFRGYTAVKSWDIFRQIIYQRDFFKIFILQYTIGNALPFIMLLLPGITARRAAIASVLVLFGVFMMRWNVVIGGQAFSLTFMGFMDYHMPIIPLTSKPSRRGSAAHFLSASSPSSFSTISTKYFLPLWRRNPIDLRISAEVENAPGWLSITSSIKRVPDCNCKWAPLSFPSKRSRGAG